MPFFCSTNLQGLNLFILDPRFQAGRERNGGGGKDQKKFQGSLPEGREEEERPLSLRRRHFFQFFPLLPLQPCITQTLAAAAAAAFFPLRVIGGLEKGGRERSLMGKVYLDEEEGGEEKGGGNVG